MRKNEDPRLSFSTPEFKEAQRIFTGGLKVKISFNQTVWQRNLAVHHAACCTHMAWIHEAGIAALLLTLVSMVHIVLQGNFNKPVEWGLIKDHAWSTPQLRKLETPVRPSRQLLFGTWPGKGPHGLTGNCC